METGQVDPRLGHQGGQSRDEIQRLKDDVRRAVAVRRLQLVPNVAVRRQRASVGLDAQRAQAILSSDEYAADVRAQQQFYLRAGIHSVPAVIINERHLISGGQPVEVFERAVRQIAANTANDTQQA